MAGVGRSRLRRWQHISTASVPAGIYGTVICASILASAGAEPPVHVALVVVITLLVYWLAERYAEVLALSSVSEQNSGEHDTVENGRPITAEHLRQVVGSGWPMIEASVTPLLVLTISKMFGASNEIAIDIALAYTLLLLVALGELAATRAGLTGWPRVVATAFAALLGLIVIGLKASLH